MNLEQLFQNYVDTVYGPDKFNVQTVKQDINILRARVESMEDGLIEIMELTLTPRGYAKNSDSNNFQWA